MICEQEDISKQESIREAFGNHPHHYFHEKQAALIARQNHVTGHHEFQKNQNYSKKRSSKKPQLHLNHFTQNQNQLKTKPIKKGKKNRSRASKSHLRNHHKTNTIFQGLEEINQINDQNSVNFLFSNQDSMEYAGQILNFQEESIKNLLVFPQLILSSQKQMIDDYLSLQLSSMSLRNQDFNENEVNLNSKSIEQCLEDIEKLNQRLKTYSNSFQQAQILNEGRSNKEQQSNILSKTHQTNKKQRKSIKKKIVNIINKKVSQKLRQLQCNGNKKFRRLSIFTFESIIINPNQSLKSNSNQIQINQQKIQNNDRLYTKFHDEKIIKNDDLNIEKNIFGTNDIKQKSTKVNTQEIDRDSDFKKTNQNLKELYQLYDQKNKIYLDRTQRQQLQRAKSQKEWSIFTKNIAINSYPNISKDEILRQIQLVNQKCDLIQKQQQREYYQKKKQVVQKKKGLALKTEGSIVQKEPTCEIKNQFYPINKAKEVSISIYPSQEYAQIKREQIVYKKSNKIQILDRFHNNPFEFQPEDPCQLWNALMKNQLSTKEAAIIDQTKQKNQQDFSPHDKKKFCFYKSNSNLIENLGKKYPVVSLIKDDDFKVQSCYSPFQKYQIYSESQEQEQSYQKINLSSITKQFKLRNNSYFNDGRVKIEYEDEDSQSKQKIDLSEGQKSTFFPVKRNLRSDRSLKKQQDQFNAKKKVKSQKKRQRKELLKKQVKIQAKQIIFQQSSSSRKGQSLYFEDYFS